MGNRDFEQSTKELTRDDERSDEESLVPSSTQPEKKVSVEDQSSEPLIVEKNSARSKRAEIQNPLLHESY